MIQEYLFLLLGFLLLFFGGEILVRGAVSLSLKLRISTLVIGMTVVSFATSAPELFVSLQAIFNNSSNIALGNTIGSNIANITLVLGVTAMICKVQIPKKISSFNYPFLLFSSLLLGIILYFFNGITLFFGLLFIALLLLFTGFLILDSINSDDKSSLNQNEILDNGTSLTLTKSIFFLTFGVVMLKYGADLLVDSCQLIAKDLGISDRIIAVTVFSFGTSVPELATSVIAALKKENNLAIGNLIGSNIFNVFAVLGITACFKEINIDDTAILSFDYSFMISITLLLGLLIYGFSKKEISKKGGFLLLIIYLFYICINIFNATV